MADYQINTESANRTESAVHKKVTYLEPMPNDFSLPSAVPVCNKVKGNLEVTATFKRPGGELVNYTPSAHKVEPVDGEARRLAQDVAKPACWRDLYWHLIGSREFKTDEEKVRAIFTWLCSTPLGLQPFPSDAEGNGVQKARYKGKQPIDSPDSILPKLMEGKTNYVQVGKVLYYYLILVYTAIMASTATTRPTAG